MSPESVYATAGSAAVGLTGLAMLLNGMLLAGLMRQGSGTRRIDVESLAIVATWIVALVVVAT